MGEVKRVVAITIPATQVVPIRRVVGIGRTLRGAFGRGVVAFGLRRRTRRSLCRPLTASLARTSCGQSQFNEWVERESLAANRFCSVAAIDTNRLPLTCHIPRPQTAHAVAQRINDACVSRHIDNDGTVSSLCERRSSRPRCAGADGVGLEASLKRQA